LQPFALFRPTGAFGPQPTIVDYTVNVRFGDEGEVAAFVTYSVDLARSTVVVWVGKSTLLLEPMADAIGKQVRAGQALFADDTPVKMSALNLEKTK